MRGDRFTAHFIAEKTGQSLYDVLSLPVDEFESWVAYFTVKAREEKKAQKKR